MSDSKKKEKEKEKLSDIRQYSQYELDKVIKIKQFSSMSPSSKELPLLWSPCNLSWIQSSLPEVWGDLVEGWGAKAGVVVLKTSDEDSLYENATFGYGEDGFFYEFLSRNSSDWNRVFSSESPTVLASDSHSLFLDPGIASVHKIGSLSSPLGFLVLEWEKNPSDAQLYTFYLLAKWIESGFGSDLSRQETTPFDAYYVSIPGLLSDLEGLSKKPFFCVSGESGSGKKTFAKYYHDRHKKGAAFLLLETIPDHLGKLEKSLLEWVSQAGSGTLVFAGIENWTEGQQATIYSFLKEEIRIPQILFLEEPNPETRYYPPFAKLALTDKILFPGLSALPKESINSLIEIVFRELVNGQKRGSLELSMRAKEFLAKKGEISSIAELKNRLSSGILHCKGMVVEVEDFDLLSEEISLPEWEDLHLRRGTKALERQKILLAMRIFSGNQLRMAKALGISRGSLQYKLKQLGIQTQ